MPILQQYGPALIQQCEAAEALALRLVREWLQEWMLAGKRNRAKKADAIANYFASYEEHRSHSLGISREQARKQGVNVTDLEADQGLQDGVLSVHHATMHTLQGAAIKIVENHLGRAFVKVTQQIMIQVPAAIPPPGQAPMG